MSSAPFGFCKSGGEFHRIKMALSFGTVVPERKKEDVQDYKDEDGSVWEPA